MNKKYININILGRGFIIAMTCFLLISTAFSASTTSLVEEKDKSLVQLNHLSYDFLFIEPEFDTLTISNNGYSQIHMSGCIALGKDAGNPKLPVKFIKLLLPPMKSIKTIEVSGHPVEVSPQDIDLIDKPLIPYQNPVPVGLNAYPEDFVINKNVYTSDKLYPKNIHGNYNVGYSRGYTILDMSLNPIQYNPIDGKIIYYDKITVNLQLEDNGYVNEFYRENPDDEEWVKKLVYNPEIANYYSNNIPTTEYPGGLCDPSDDYDYVIITTTLNELDYWDTSEDIPYNWESLMDRHEDEGLNCTLVTIEDIEGCDDYQGSPPFNDQQAHIREFCKDAYEDWGTDYVLIGGDDEWIPAREMDYSYEGNVDSDVYWSNLDKTFNADEDSDWGEEGDLGLDGYCELFIGRITCDEPQDVSNWMTKSFYYTDSGDIDYLENMGFYGGDMGWPCEGDTWIDYCAIKGADDYFGPNPGDHGPYPSWLGFQYGYETWNNNNPGQPYNLSVKWTGEPTNPGWQGGSTSAAITGFKNAINNDDVTLIAGVAHANADMSLDVQYTEWESQYTNTKPFFIHDWGCHCGDMDAGNNGDGVLHSMLFHSDTELAFACIYNTCYGWGSFQDTNSSSALQMKAFFDYLLDTENNSGNPGNWQLGKAMGWSKDVMAPTVNWTYSSAPGSWRGVFQGCLLFGDPAQLIKPTNAPPEKPEQPDGPTEGVTEVEYEYTSTAIEPEGEKIYYLFDWGDGTDSGWIGPYNSGQEGKASHSWEEEGYYDVKVKAKDENGGEGPWSDPLNVHVLQAPWMDIGLISGGLFKINAVIKNIGSIDATDVGWTISLEGGAFMGKESTGVVDTIPAGDEVTVSSGFILGLGKTIVTVDATIPENSDSRTQDGMIYLFYVYVNPSGH